MCVGRECDGGAFGVGECGRSGTLYLVWSWLGVH